MYTTQLSHTDKAIINNEIMDFVPKRILDIHAHLYASHHFDKTAFPFLHNNSSLNFIKYKEAMVRTLGERKVDGLLFGMPHKSGNRPAISEWFYKAIADSAMSKAL